MNEMNELEKQLRSWTPRRPSPKLERELWPARRPAPRTSHTLAWLVPVTACFLFVCLGLNQQSAATFSDTTRRGTMVAVILSNQSYAAYLPGSFQRANNRVDTFEWTNDSRSTSSMRFVSPIKANDLR